MDTVLTLNSERKISNKANRSRHKTVRKRQIKTETDSEIQITETSISRQRKQMTNKPIKHTNTQDLVDKGPTPRIFMICVTRSRFLPF